MNNKNIKKILLPIIILVVLGISAVLLSGKQNNIANPSSEKDYTYLLDSVDKEIFTIESKKYPCTGSGPMECLKVQVNQKGDFMYFYSPIEGFDFQDGNQYILLIKKEAVLNPPADGSSIKYTLLEILEKVRI